MAKSYQASGVNLEAGYEVVSRIKKHVKSTDRPGVMGNIGSFGGMFDLGSLGYEHPILVSGTDGVGTKLKIAFDARRHDTIGIDAVAMCVNDVLAQGAQPLIFLDYVAVGKNHPEVVEAIVAGVAEGCRQAGCALVGGETAEMPGMYDEDEYDIAGFTVGAVEKSRLIDCSKVSVGDILIGLPSSGVHSNGFSLVRKIITDNSFAYTDTLPETHGQTLSEVLLTPTRIYVRPVLNLLKEVDIHGLAHITGGGFDENIPRILKDGQGVEISEGSWEILPVFRMLEKYGNVPHREMFNIFNMGIGMVIAVAPEDAERTLEVLRAEGEDPKVIGKVIKGKGVTLL
ncbi:MAG: phosphoribosylformylglycinamidine cyclo-ligase [Muribaculaceae bacterium]|nr:phosphoribosylformylglycinamidine cyclo-ligase [Muribaculaceae bacterium]